MESPAAKCPFVLGLVGSDQLTDEDQDALVEDLKRIITFLQKGTQAQAWEGVRPLLDPIDDAEAPTEVWREWPGLGAETPIVLLTNCASPIEEKMVAEAPALDFQIKIPSATETDPNDKNSFEIYLKKELAADPELFAKSPQERGAVHTDSEDRTKAAVHYIAGYSDLLLAIGDVSDHRIKEAIRAKRQGLEPGLLALTPSFHWADNGPVFHLTRTPGEDGSPQVRLEISHPIDLLPEGQDLSATQKEGYKLIQRIAYYTSRFNKWTPEKDWNYGEPPLEFMIQNSLEKDCGVPIFDQSAEDDDGRLPRHQASKIEDDFRDEIQEESARRHLETLRPIADLRAKASYCSDRHSSRRKRILSALFLLSLAGAIFMHLFAHWHERHPTEEGETHGPTVASSTHHYSWIRPILGLAGLALACSGIMRFIDHRARGTDEIHNDSRALAEGLRVQFFWAAAGLRRSVAANYMQRQRSELDWIRSAISGVASPYEKHQIKFLGLSFQAQSALFRLVNKRWVKGQAQYFRKATHTQHEKLHFWHRVGAISAIAGLLQALTLIGLTCFPHLDTEKIPSHTLATCAWGSLGIAILLVLVRWFAGSSAAKTIAGWCTRRKKPERKGPISEPETAPREFDEVLREILHRLAPLSNEGREILSRAERRRLRFHDFLVLLPAAAALALLLLGLVFLVTATMPTWPDILNLGILTMGTSLLGGALSLAWAEKNFYAEHSQQYASMADLFEATYRRCDAALADYDKAITARQEAAEKKDTERQREAEDRLREVREHLHALYFALGKEALDENAEWLILHRSRPTEPVLPG